MNIRTNKSIGWNFNLTILNIEDDIVSNISKDVKSLNFSIINKENKTNK